MSVSMLNQILLITECCFSDLFIIGMNMSDFMLIMDDCGTANYQ